MCICLIICCIFLVVIEVLVIVLIMCGKLWIEMCFDKSVCRMCCNRIIGDGLEIFVSSF